MQKKRKNPRIHLVVLLLLAIVAAVYILQMDTKTPTADDNAVSAQVYFIKPPEAAPKPFAVSLEQTDDENKLVLTLLDKLFKGPTNSNYTASIPQSVKLEGINIVTSSEGKKIVEVTLNSEFANLKKSEQAIARSAIILTLAKSFSFIDLVEVTSNVLDSVETTTTLEALGQDEVVTEAVFEPAPINTEISVDLYFVSLDEMDTVKEKRTIPTSSQNIAKYVLDELVKGPADKTTSTTFIPSETRVMNVDVEDGLCTVNLSNDFRAKMSNGSSASQKAVKQIVNTLVKIPKANITKVRFLIDSEPVSDLKEMKFNGTFEYED